MRVIAQSTLRKFWEEHKNAEGPLRAWYAEAKAADWKTTADIKAQHGSASVLQRGRVVFNIGGSKYRLLVHLKYPWVNIRFIGTHKEYDDIDAQTY